MRFASSTLLYFILLIIGGHVLIPVLLATFAFSRKVHRNPTFLSWMITWIIYSVSLCLTLYSKQELYGQPVQSLCLIQVALNYASILLCTFGALMFVLNVWLSVRLIASPETRPIAESASWRYFSIIFPYATFVVVLLVIAIVGVMNPTSVAREETSFFCSMDLPIVRAVQGIGAVVVLFVLYFEGLVVVLLLRMHKRKIYLRRSGGPAPTYHLCIRIALFTSYIIFFIVTAAFTWSKTTKGSLLTFSYFFLSSVPLAVFIMFGTQRDLLSAYARGFLWIWYFVVPKRDADEVEGAGEGRPDIDKPLPPLPGV